MLRTAARRAFAQAVPIFLGAAAMIFSACFHNGNGDAPPDQDFYFPVGLALSASGQHLFVVNSNFDLRYSAGTLLALDTKKIEDAAKACADADPTDASCTKSAVTPYVDASVRIGAFGADVVETGVYKAATPGVREGRLLIPVRGDATLTFVDYREAADLPGGVAFYCNSTAAAPAGDSCAASWRVGADPTANSRQLALEGEPFAVAVPTFWPTAACSPTDPASAADPPRCQEPRLSRGIAATVHQISGDVSVFVGTAIGEAGSIPGARLAFTLTGLPGGGTFITPLDLTDESPFTPRFLVTNRSQAAVYVVSYFGDRGVVDRGFLSVTDVVPIPTQSGGFDSRGIVVDPPGPDETRPIRVFVTSRSPASLIIGEIDPKLRRLHFITNQSLPIGPSRILRARLKKVMPDGTVKTRTKLFITSFDTRYITSFDPDTGLLGNVVRTGKGPYAMAVDETNGYAFISNFTESTVQVMELDPTRHPDLADKIIYTVGVPRTP